jgi:hypothetical protein
MCGLHLSQKKPEIDLVLLLVQFFCSLAVKVGKLAQDWYHSEAGG